MNIYTYMAGAWPSKDEALSPINTTPQKKMLLDLVAHIY
jgi:hypothetical protein